MARGGARQGAGRKKVERPTNANVAQKVLAQVKAEKLWEAIIATEIERIGLERPLSERPKNVSIIPLVNTLRYLEDRAYGQPVHPVNHMHDKPIEMTMELTLSERMIKALERAEERVRAR